MFFVVAGFLSFAMLESLAPMQIASDWNKPDGQFCIRGDRAEVLQFLHDLPVRKVQMAGYMTGWPLPRPTSLYGPASLCLLVLTRVTQWPLRRLDEEILLFEEQSSF